MTHHADTNTLARTAHDLGLAAWFGGALMGAAAVNPAAGEVADGDRIRVANSTWGRWMPVAAAAIGAHLAGAVKLTTGNAARIAAQRGVGQLAVLKAALTTAAVAATAASGVYGRKVMDLEAEAAARGDVLDVTDGTTPAEGSPPELAAAQRKLSLLQWAIPALTAGMLAVHAAMGEQQRPAAVAEGFLDRLTPDGIGERLSHLGDRLVDR